MATEDSPDRHAQAAEVARLLMQLADERPAVLDALQALLQALARSAPKPCDESPNEQTRTPEAEGRREDPTPPASTPVAPATAPPPPQPPRQLTPRDTASFEMLASKFRDITATVGLGNPAKAPAQDKDAKVRSSQWSEDVAEAKLVARLLRAQSRRLRRIRLALHDGSTLPQVDGVLAAERIEDWTTLESNVRAIKPRELKEGERWYSLAARAMAAIADWLDEHPDAALGYAMTPTALRERLQCLANAQKGIYCWLEESFGARMRCLVQDRVMSTLKAWIARDYWAVYLPSGMQLAQRVTSSERDQLERALQRFDLEHAGDDAARSDTVRLSTPAAPQAAVELLPSAASEANARFESVHDAFIAARERFGDTPLCFTERAEESAEDSAFLRPDEAYDFFEALHGVATMLASGARGDPHALLLPYGFYSKPSNHLTMARHHRFYHMNFDGIEIDLSQHVTLGSRNQNTCMSIHWWHDTAGKRFVIGHCGRHLPNTRS